MRRSHLAHAMSERAPGVGGSNGRLRVLRCDRLRSFLVWGFGICTPIFAAQLELELELKLERDVALGGLLVDADMKRR